jgi:hypothetical protein
MSAIEKWNQDLHACLKMLTNPGSALREFEFPPAGDTEEEELRYLFGLWSCWTEGSSSNPVETKGTDFENAIKGSASRAGNALRNVLGVIRDRITRLLERGIVLPESPVIPSAIFRNGSGGILRLNGTYALGLTKRIPAGHWLRASLPPDEELLEVDDLGPTPSIVLGPLAPGGTPLDFYPLRFALSLTAAFASEQRRNDADRHRRKLERDRLEERLDPLDPGYKAQQLERRVAALEASRAGGTRQQDEAEVPAALANDPLLQKAKAGERFAESLRSRDDPQAKKTGK